MIIKPKSHELDRPMRSRSTTNAILPLGAALALTGHNGGKEADGASTSTMRYKDQDGS